MLDQIPSLIFLLFSFFVLFPGCFAAADMTLGLILLQYMLDSVGQPFIYGRQALYHVFMHCAFTDAKNCRRLSYRMLALQNVIANVQYPLADIVFHFPPPHAPVCYHVYADKK